MKPYREMSKEELASLKEQLTAVYKEYQGKNLSLNMARGKPSPDQLDLSLPMLDVLNSKSDFMTADGDTQGIQRLENALGPIRSVGMSAAVSSATIVNDLSVAISLLSR